MKINNLQSNRTDLQNTAGAAKTTDTPAKEKNKKSIFAGDLNLSDDNPVGSKKAFAQKQALRTLLKQFASDKDVDSLYDECRRRRSGNMEGIESADDKTEKLQAARDNAQIDPESTDYKNAELLRKKMKTPGYSFSEEEKEQLGELADADLSLIQLSITRADKLTPHQKEVVDSMPLSDYQRDVLTFDTLEQQFAMERERDIQEANNASKEISSIKLERLKADPMNDAKKEAEQILEDASKAIISDITQSGIDKVDEETEENKEKIKEEQEKKEKEEEIKGEKNDNITDDITEQTIEKSTSMDDIKQEIRKLMNAQNILDEDLKGSAIDEEL